MMAAVIFSVGLLAGPALAQNGGVGGEGDYQSTGQSGGVGGVAGVNGGVGGDGGAPNRSCNCTGGGGGGGAEGAAGGAGGPGGAGSRPVGGTGGGVGQDGATGAIGLGTASGGGGGGGAASGPSGATLNNTAMLTGGNGGKGGDGGVDHSDPSNRLAGGGGGGGAGGSAFTITGPGSDTNSGSITGGNGGAGGAGDVGGSGGDGGHGIVVTASGVTINNSGSISGGAGGAGGAQVSDTYSDGGDPVYGGTRGRPGAAGIGGSGIIGAGLTIINSGSIAGGTGSGVAGNAISFTGGANTLTSSGGTLTGNLGIANGVGASLTFLQTSAAGASGDLTISGITGLTGGATDAAVAIKIDGGRAFKITGASNYSGGTSVSDGSTIIIGNSNALGSGTLTMGETLAGHTTLVLNGNGLSIANNIVINSDPVVTVAAGNTNTMTGVISGAGDIVLNGGGTLVLSGANTYTGGTTICGTACGVAGGGSVLVVGTDTVGTPGAIVSSAIGTGRLTFDGGTLQAGGNYTIANEAAINANGGTIDSNGYRFTYSGNIADGAGGSGSLLIKDSTGTGAPVTLSGSNTYSGGTSVIGTTVRATNSSSFGSGAVTLQDARVQIGGTSNLTIANNFNINSSTYGSALDANGKTLTIAGNIADGNGPGRLTITDSTFRRSTVVLLGTSTYSGGTAICNCATLVLGDASHTASIVGQVSNDGFLYVRNANTSAITSLTNNGYTEFSGATIAGAMAITNQSSLAFSARAAPATPRSRRLFSAARGLERMEVRTPAPQVMRRSTTPAQSRFLPRRPMPELPPSSIAPIAARHFTISRRPPERQSPTILAAKPCSAGVVRSIPRPPATPSSPTTTAVRRGFKAMQPPAAPSSSPIPVVRRSSTAIRPAATRSSSRMTPGSSRSPAVSVRTVMAGSRPARSPAQAPTISAAATRSWSVATTSRRWSAA
ncbi:hypothetical protein CWS35_17285 [Bradyrhizobium sp. SK17]|nr:hypothetical protein CWS35_17285 [Bradyrhizobium sp. SK17]